MKRCLACLAEFEGRDWRCERCGWQPAAENGWPLFAPELAHGGGPDAEYCWSALAAAEPRHFWFRARRRLILLALARHMVRPRRALDVGCGNGFILLGLRERFPGLELSGADLRSEGLAYAAARVPGVDLFQMDARRMPFSAEFDAVGAFDVIEHIAEDEAALAEIFRALQPGGCVVLTVPQHPFLWNPADDFSHHQRRYSRRELRAKLAAAGFGPIWATSFFSLLLPLLLAVRWYQRWRGAPFDPASEVRVGPGNGALELVMRIEEALISWGVRFPAGGSLLMVGRKPA